MLSTIIPLSLALLTLLPSVVAQTWTACDPTKTTCAPNIALGMTQAFNFTQQTVTDATIWNATSGVVDYNGEGGAFSVRRRFDSPTIQSNFYLFFGTVEVIMKAASGQGIISSIVLESDDLDEIDWELMGGNTTHAETNYFGKGNITSFDRAIYYPINEPQKNFHNYTIDWSAEKIDWFIDGAMVRSLKYAEANGGHNFPQTPMNVRLGIWAGGDPSMPNGTIEWAGGPTDFSQGPYTMWVSSIKVKDASKGSTYTYGDKTGSWQSIKIARYVSSLANHFIRFHSAPNHHLSNDS